MKMHLEQAVLALDPGGSKCDAVLARPDGTVIGWGRAQKPGLSGRNHELIGAAATQAIGGCTFEELHVVTRASTAEKGILPCSGASRLRVWRVPEAQGPLTLVGQTFGVVVVETVQRLVERGITPPVFMSANLDGGDAFNAEQLRLHRHQIHYL